ncbi:hypothetical protein B0G71_7963 [Paraburkholderia sp. BL27I4N3]|nr:hypothetical protein B0G71_7963 [Paraburkholderia sp. BL27I4N3]
MFQVDLFSQRLPEEISLRHRRLRTHLHLVEKCRIHALICKVPAIPTTVFRTQSPTPQSFEGCSGPTIEAALNLRPRSLRSAWWPLPPAAKRKEFRMTLGRCLLRRWSIVACIVPPLEPVTKPNPECQLVLCGRRRESKHLRRYLQAIGMLVIASYIHVRRLGEKIVCARADLLEPNSPR